jgi:lipoate-protein ligase B
VRPARHVEWGRVAYRDAFERQKAHWAAVKDGTAEDTIFTLEHEPVITLGRRATLEQLHSSRESLAARGVDVVETDRGGELTYHGPGQLVVYPILHIKERGIHVGDLVRGLAGAVSAVIEREFGVVSQYDGDRPGLWVDGAKIAAVGMRISRGVSMHGTALNVTTNLDAFSLFVPCGLPEASTTSLSALGHEPPPVATLGRMVAEEFATKLLGVELS